MAKTIKNKVYNEFWEDGNLEIKKTESKTESNVSSDEIKKLEKKISKKVTGLEKEIKELKEDKKVENPVVEEIKPVNRPKGWQSRNKFVDDIGNEFCKGKFVGKVEVETEPKIPTSDQLKKIKPMIEKSAEKIIPDAAIELSKKEKVVKEVILPKEETITVQPPPIILTDKDIYQQYINDDIPFKMYFRGNLIFDSKVQPLKNYPIFQDDGFILFGKNYIYRGIRIEKY